MTSPRRVLVTGGAGFIGSHLVDALLAEGWSVLVLDDLSMGRTENLPAHEPRMELLVGTVENASLCDRAASGVEVIFHLAARNSVPRSLADPRGTFATNVIGSLNVMEAARQQGVPRVIYASSSSVYGAPLRLPEDEQQPLAARNPYSATQVATEQLAQAWTHSFGVPTIGLRYFNVFGPRQRPQSTYGAVVPRFIEACLRQSEAVINGDGEQSRDFTYVANVVQANLRALNASEVCFGRVYNIAMGNSISVKALYQHLAELTGSSRPPRHVARRPGDVLHSQADTSAASRELGFTAHVPFEEGLRKTLAWYRLQDEAWWRQ